MNVVALIFLSPILVNLSNLVALGEDWPQWRGPFRNGTTTETHWSHRWPGGEPNKLWTAEVGIGFACVVIAERHAYTLGNRGGSNVVTCIDALDGTVKLT
jgi:outer membrane protein assembly factor BamB